MKIFMSHSSRQKLFVKELRKYLPEHIELWIDEKKLLVGESLNQTIKKTIMEDIDFLILIVDRDGLKSNWVKIEFELGLAREKELGRIFILPILLEDDIWNDIDNAEFKERKFIKCYEFTDAAIQATSSQLINEIFAWVCKELFDKKANLSHNASSLSKIEEAEELLNNIAEKIRLLVYPYRDEKPLDLLKLLDLLKEQDHLVEYNIFEFNEFLLKLKKSGHLTGLVSDGESIWVKQEHHLWKKSIHTSNKIKIAKKALTFIDSGMKIAMDSGSTTLEIARQICQGLSMERWSNLVIITNSIPVAQELLSFSSELGLEDNNNIVKVFMIEGRIRPNSLAVVNDHQIYDNTVSGFQETLSKLGGADLCFVGANGLYNNEGFAVHNNFEIKTKQGMLENSKRKIIVCDPSKFNISEKKMFANFSDSLEILTCAQGFDNEIKKMEAILAGTNSKLVIAN
ncbi:MAG: TIR domain-containing protein [Bacteroidia bacterium]